MTVSEALATLAAVCGGDSARADAEILLAHALKLPRSRLHARLRDELPSALWPTLQAQAARRAAGEPVAYLTGTQGFWSLELAVNPAVLIPRPETETLVAWALECLPDAAPLRIADLGTGSGAIALALAQERPQAQVLAVDISPEALQVARSNAARLNLNNVQFRCADFAAALASPPYDLIVSNPPYIAEDDTHLAALMYEPQLALTAGPQGLDALRVIAHAAPQALHSGGRLLLEHGFDQADAVRELLRAAGFVQIATRRDAGGHERVSGGVRP